MTQLLRQARVVAFFALVLTGTLLSIISIVVVLELRTVVVPPELSHEQLLATLTSSQQASEARQNAPLSFQLDSSLLAAAHADPSERGRTLQAYYVVAQRLAEQWQAQRNALLAEAQDAAGAAALTYAAEAKRPGDRDRLLRFVEVKRWHHEQTQKADSVLDERRASLGKVNEALLALRVEHDSMVHATALDLRKRVNEAESLLNQSHKFTPLEARQDIPLWEPGPRLHPFSALAGWLRTQQSLELASIIGMLGFGLLGAAASTVVRTPGEGKRKPRIGDNLTSLVVSGTTAAFATYLAVKGSLAVVSTDGAEPNPYVLLLTCFVASVYWEDAWERVRKAVRGHHTDDDDEPSADGSSGDEQPGGRRKMQIHISDASAEAAEGAEKPEAAEQPA
jgi:hypothetical protein